MPRAWRYGSAAQRRERRGERTEPSRPVDPPSSGKTRQGESPTPPARARASNGGRKSIEFCSEKQRKLIYAKFRARIEEIGLDISGESTKVELKLIVQKVAGVESGKEIRKSMVDPIVACIAKWEPGQ